MFFDNNVHKLNEPDPNFSLTDEISKGLDKWKSSTQNNISVSQKISESPCSPSLHSISVPIALHLPDDTLISMLSLPPKSVPQMRTKSSFQDFFRGIPEERMKRLLHRAYGNLNDLDREVKVRKRMELLAGVLTNV